MAIIEEIKSFIENLKLNPRIVTFDEAATKQFIILPLLNSLGWDIHNIEEVRPEFPIENKKVDFSLHVCGKLIFLEAKRVGEDLEHFEKQLLEYSFLWGVEFAILTNGTLWWFYLPMKKGSWQTRKFATLDLNKQDSLHVAQNFVDLLSRKSVGTLENAEAIYRSKSIADTLSSAWNKLIADPDLTIIDRLTETTKEICGYSPNADEVKYFFEQHSNRLFIPIEEKKNKTKQRKSENILRATSVVVALNIAQLLDAIATEYLKQSRHLPAHNDNVTVYSHPDYFLKFTVRRSLSSNDCHNPSNFDQLEFVATSKQIVNAFERYCALNGIQNLYITASVFAAKLRQEKDLLSKARWEMVSRSATTPYFRRVNGMGYLKFVKVG